MTSRIHEGNEPDQAARKPSSRIWASAMAGLLGLGGGACSDGKNHVDPDPTPDAAVDAAPQPDAPPDAETPSKIISETPGEHTFAELKAMCDARGGYIEIHAACSGTNTCAGFSYGDWGSEAVLTEHSCNAVSGCNGLGCVVLPSDTSPGHGRTAVQILSEAQPDTEGVAQRSCNYCHAEWSGAQFDVSKFTVHVEPGSGRNLTNWLQRSPEAQARIIAFGSHLQAADGQQLGNMAGYYKNYSRAEIERVVTYIRSATVTPVLVDTKLVDPAMPFTARLKGPRGSGRARLLKAE